MEYDEVKIRVPKVGKGISDMSKLVAVSVANTIGVGLAVVADKLINFGKETEKEGGEKND